MKLILLAGNNKNSNENWIYEVEKKLSSFFDETYIQYYGHREQKKPEMDIEYESKSFIDKINQTDNYVIFAKSAGSIIAMKNIYENGLKPKFCIFVGVPMGMIFRNEFPYEKWFKNIDIPILFIQKTNDPVCSYDELVKLFSGFSEKFKFVEVEGNDHHYSDLDLLESLVVEFIK